MYGTTLRKSEWAVGMGFQLLSSITRLALASGIEDNVIPEKPSHQNKSDISLSIRTNAILLILAEQNPFQHRPAISSILSPSSQTPTISLHAPYLFRTNEAFKTEERIHWHGRNLQLRFLITAVTTTFQAQILQNFVAIPCKS